MAARIPLVVIVGPTASGKTGLGIRLAKEFGGEIISADSRAVYSGLDIGTAKPDKKERDGIPHWGFDLANPGERFTAAQFKQYAVGKIDEIRSRGNTPFLVGGTGLYVDAVVYDFQFPESGNDQEKRRALDRLSIENLHDYCRENNIKLPENKLNKRYVINNILRKGEKLQRQTELPNETIIVGITTEKSILLSRIKQRAEDMFSEETEVEALRAAERYGWNNEAMTGNIYPLIKQIVRGELDLSEAKKRFVTIDWRLAKRQLTWFRRNEHIKWLSLDEAYTYIAQQLVDLSKS